MGICGAAPCPDTVSTQAERKTLQQLTDVTGWGGGLPHRPQPRVRTTSSRVKMMAATKPEGCEWSLQGSRHVGQSAELRFGGLAPKADVPLWLASLPKGRDFLSSPVCPRCLGLMSK